MNSQLDNLTGHNGPLAKAHDTRNLGEYEGDLNVDERLVTDLVAAAQTVAGAVQQLTTR